MAVLSKRRIQEFCEIHSDAADELKAWFAIARKAQWQGFTDVRMNFKDADQVGRVLVFNIRRTVYRLIVKVDYRSQLLMVKDFLTHKEYGRDAWKKWC